jgi:hypothetical protein
MRGYYFDIQFVNEVWVQIHALRSYIPHLSSSLIAETSILMTEVIKKEILHCLERQIVFHRKI